MKDSNDKAAPTYDHLSVLAPSNEECTNAAQEYLERSNHASRAHVFLDSITWLLGWQRENVAWQKLVQSPSVPSTVEGQTAWQYVQYKDYEGTWDIEAKDGSQYIGRIYGSEKQAELIARAPMMEKELQRLNTENDRLEAEREKAVDRLELILRESAMFGDRAGELYTENEKLSKELQEARALLADCERFAAAAPAYPGKYELQKRIVAALASSTSKETKA